MKTGIRVISLYILSPLLSFIGGFYAYITTLRLVWDQSLGGDFNFVLYYGSIAYFLILFPIYLVPAEVNIDFDTFVLKIQDIIEDYDAQMIGISPESIAKVLGEALK